jgi:hypothetical protein
MEIEHLGYLVKSDDDTFELILKLRQAINDEDARRKIEDFFDTFSIKVNVITLVNVATEDKSEKHERRYNMPSLEKRQFIVLHYLPSRFTVRHYVDYYIGQGGDEKPFKSNFYATIHPLLEEGRIKDTGQRQGRSIIYERIKQEEDEGQPGDRTDVLVLEKR